MNHEFAPKKKSIEDFTQDELEKYLHVYLAPDLSPADLIQHLKDKTYGRILVDTNFNVYLGITSHMSMSTSLGNPGLIIRDGYIEKLKYSDYDFTNGDWGIFFHTKPPSVSLARAVGKKVIEYLKTLGL